MGKEVGGDREDGGDGEAGVSREMRVAVIGCGVVGAAIAYELSQVSGLDVIVLDQRPPAQGATRAALGVLMGVISHKVKGRNWRLRQASMQRYETLIPELEERTARVIPFNRQGILSLCFTLDELPKWEKLVGIRRTQGWLLEIWTPQQAEAHCPHLNIEQVTAAIYSPQDRQVDPTALTLALVSAAQQNGVAFQFDSQVIGFESKSDQSILPLCRNLQTSKGPVSVDWVVISAGLGSTELTAAVEPPVEIGPVLGQALQLKLDAPLGNLDFQPVVNGADIHLVPLGRGGYWIGATVEFPPETMVKSLTDLKPDDERLADLLKGAIAYCPALAKATLVKKWSGLRPRPQRQPAPIISPLASYRNVLLATGHYRNGVLLAPATAQAVREAIT